MARNLVNVIPTVIEKREARLHTGSKASILGILGAEFACVVTGIDSFAHVSDVVTGLEKAHHRILKSISQIYWRHSLPM
ncbi:MAG: hypothetical protein KIG65_08395 [Eubacteriales bacterium]|nr:hypothetical protein [Eubacteriales bacterium]